MALQAAVPVWRALRSALDPVAEKRSGVVSPVLRDHCSLEHLVPLSLLVLVHTRVFLEVRTAQERFANPSLVGLPRVETEGHAGMVWHVREGYSQEAGKAGAENKQII